MRMPVLFVGHGSPMNAIEENAFTQTLRKLSPTLPKPKTICVVSAHWVTRGSQVLTVERPRTIHDFYGFPKALYDVQYPAPGAAVEAKRLAFEQHLLADHQWGFDHGTWSILRHIYPDADVPVFQVSLDHGRTFAEHIVLAQELRGLRDRGVLIIGSGNLVHNLNQMNWSMEHCAYPRLRNLTPTSKKRSTNAILLRFRHPIVGEPRSLLQLTRPWNITLPSYTPWAAPTSAILFLIPTKELNWAVFPCAWPCSNRNFP